MSTIPGDHELQTHLLEALRGDERSSRERQRFAELICLFAELPPPRDRHGLYPDYRQLKDRFLEQLRNGSGEAIEEAFLTLYCHVHGYEAPYTREERRRVDETGGYWCHAGGLSPILKAGEHIHKNTVSADFGAGNGLQALLFQKLYPHKKTIQVEISSRMVEVGQDLQRWLDIDDASVDWIVGDVLDAKPRGMDFIYLYRPVRPQGEGIRFYQQFAATVDAEAHPIVIFSIADCLGGFLSARFEKFYTDGHLTCYRTLLR